MNSTGKDRGSGVRSQGSGAKDHFRPLPFQRKPHAKNRRGMTLVEVILGAAILGILAVLVTHTLFYPRFLAVSKALKQQAILAGTGALEQVFSQPYNSLYDRTSEPLADLSSRYSVNGRTVSGNLSVETLGGGGGNPEYKHVTVAVNYQGGETPVVLETYRSPLN